MASAQNPSISVVMACYNATRWLNDAVDSVLAQTYQDFELILVDDGSTDETGTVIERRRDSDERIVSIIKQHSGLADSLNAGIGIARGKWIARLDADDLCEPTRFERQIAFLESRPDVVLLGTGFVEIDESGQTIKKHHYPPDHDRLVRHLERMQRMFPHSSAIFRRETVTEVGGYNVLFGKSQDWDLWLRIAEQGQIACLRQCLLKIRKHATQISVTTGNRSQLLWSHAASACHFLRLQSQADPSTSDNLAVWSDFLDWVETQIDHVHAREMEKVWVESRNVFFSANDRPTAFLKLIFDIVKSGYAIRLLWLKFSGSALPRRLAGQWPQKSCVAS